MSSLCIVKLKLIHGRFVRRVVIGLKGRYGNLLAKPTFPVHPTLLCISQTRATITSEKKQLPTEPTPLPVKPAVWLFQERMKNSEVSPNCATTGQQERIIPDSLWGGTPQNLLPSWIPGSLAAALSTNVLQSSAQQLCGSLHSGWDLTLCGGQQLLAFLRNHLTGVSLGIWGQAPKARFYP